MVLEGLTGKKMSFVKAGIVEVIPPCRAVSGRLSGSGHCPLFFVSAY